MASAGAHSRPTALGPMLRHDAEAARLLGGRGLLPAVGVVVVVSPFAFRPALATLFRLLLSPRLGGLIVRSAGRRSVAGTLLLLASLLPIVGRREEGGAPPARSHARIIRVRSNLATSFFVFTADFLQRRFHPLARSAGLGRAADAIRFRPFALLAGSFGAAVPGGDGNLGGCHVPAHGATVKALEGMATATIAEWVYRFPATERTRLHPLLPIPARRRRSSALSAAASRPVHFAWVHSPTLRQLQVMASSWASSDAGS